MLIVDLLLLQLTLGQLLSQLFKCLQIVCCPVSGYNYPDSSAVPRHQGQVIFSDITRPCQQEFVNFDERPGNIIHYSRIVGQNL